MASSDALDIADATTETTVSIEPDHVRAVAKRKHLVAFYRNCPRNPYVKLTIPPQMANVTTIRVSVSSHDQGHVDDPSQGFWSYFHIVVVDPDGHERKRWFAFHNHNDRTTEAHPLELTWPVEPHSPHLCHRFRSFRPNDTVCLIPHADFPNWKNCVHAAEIEIKGTVAKTVDDGREAGSLEVYGAAVPQSLYTPLDSSRREIRLLEILVGPRESPVQGKLKTVSLSSAEATLFQALSYCWGNITEMNTILISGHHFPVSQNLHNALVRIRERQTCSTFLWLDVICVNQQDLGERSEQIQAMKWIYSTATHVIIWIGELSPTLPDDATTQVCALLNRHGAMPDDTSPSELSADDIHASHGLFEVEWFTRVWVLQEVFLAKQAFVLCGNQMIPWSTLLRLNGALCRKYDDVRAVRRTIPAAFYRLFSLQSPSNAPGYIKVRQEGNILDFLVAALDLEATDPRDKIFALLNIFPEDCIIDLQPDYTKHVADVYRDFTKWWIMKESSLRILSAVHCSVGRTWQRYTRLPSKVSDPPRSSWSFWYDGKSAWRLATLGLSPNATYSACGVLKLEKPLLQSSTRSTLLLRGFILGKVARTSRHFLYSDWPTPRHNNLRSAYDLLFDPLNSRHVFEKSSTGEAQTWSPFERAYGPPHEPSLRESDEHILAHLHEYGRAEYYNGTLVNWGGNLSCHPRAQFKTDTGLWGLMPSAALEGDYIVILYGGRVPYLVRDSDGTSNKLTVACGDNNSEGTKTRRVTFVGECYVDGNMHGEAVERNMAEPIIFELV